MVHKRCSFFLLLVVLSVSFVQSQVSIAPEPSWVISENYNPNVLAPENGTDGGTQILLYTEQVNIDLEEAYIKSVTKAVEYSGMQNISTVVAEYDPSYQILRFHKIAVIRNGTSINKLEYQDIQTARRETNAENFIYDGTLSAFVNIPDVRLGDIVTYSYSIKGFNPIQKNKFSTSFTLNSTQEINTLSFHIFGNKKLNYRVLNSDLEVNYQLNNGVHHYNWSAQNVPAILIEDQSPTWYIQNALVFVSEYDSWAEVINWGKEIFTFTEPNNDELRSTIAAIKKTYPKEGDRIKAALAFVQNEVRYLAIHSGIGGYKPNSPNKVITQRFGDCKDKSVLFTALLNAMDIEAYPALVNTSLRQLLPSLSPSSKLFDHCIVKVVDKRGVTLWYDPTLTNQGGRYDSVYIPNYRYGLVLDQNLKAMDTIPDFGTNMVEVFSTFKLNEMGKGAELEVRTNYYEGEADFMRGVFRNNNMDIIEKELLKYYAETYVGISTIESPVIVDDTLNNEFALLERYQIDSIWRPSSENTNRLNLSIFPTSITNVLSMPNQLERTAPLALSYPMVRKQSIKVELPERIQVQSESSTINSDFFYYDYSSDYSTSTNVLTLDYYYKSQGDHVPIAKFDEFYRDMTQLDQQIGYLIYMDKNGSALIKNIPFSLGKFFGFGLIALVFIVLVVIIIVLLQQKRK